MDSQTPLTDEEKEAVLKMAGVLIRTSMNGQYWVARGPNKLMFAFSTSSKEVCIYKAFNRLREQTNG